MTEARWLPLTDQSMPYHFREADTLYVQSLDSLLGLTELPIRVNSDGTLIADQWEWNTPEGLYGDTDAELHTEAGAAGWDLLTGYSGQHGYRGPVMHPSEFIGGKLARDILATPGVYAAITVENLDDPENPSGWVVLRKR